MPRHLNWQRILPALMQILVLSLVIGLGIVIWGNINRNLEQTGIRLGFDFLNSQASFNLRETPISYQPTDTYSRALLVGLINTLKVMVIAIGSATILGFTIGIARLSGNWLVRNLGMIYVEIIRNTPLLLQIFLWYSVFLSLPKASIKLVWGLVQINIEGINFLGLHFYPEFSALVIGLTIYQASFIAEVVRGSILAISQGQWQAARAMGFKNLQVLQLVILPQAFRIIIPPLTSQYVNIAKNSSLGAAIAYEDMYAIASTTFNQTGRSVEVVGLLAVTYLVISLSISLIMNLVNIAFPNRI
ncbi:amine acid ABC transporter, permease protein, 3-TM region, His/Glu/Gln/Arg/opine family [Synechococcus sp. PCC 7502]|uniref:ABC transporter permease subunit n=1 Tax=Synechococcus sp. PCC 7502 TaxID=1173263 RepID=UPI00029FF911|nr:ABC transporter permease subunit [Synechococcus sp. PCC 7502]AFY72300.1 amine acid ABC transporter, permease protein, 3-TM region, His/Glu/Gln/Arg/opine family [Synechococcus sp. PCC 7502]